MCLIKLLKLLRRQQLSILQQFGVSVVYTVVGWHKLGEVNNEYTLHIFIVLAISVPKIIKFGGDLTKFWQKQAGQFFGTPYKFAPNICALYGSIAAKDSAAKVGLLYIRLGRSWPALL